MEEQWMQHIGDDQLVNGMPKHMVGVSASMEQKKSGPVPGDPPYRTRPKKAETGTFWTVHPKDKACDKCKAMAGIQFEEEPERPPPNCKCEIRKHGQERRKYYIDGSIQGYEGSVVRLFHGLGHVKVTINHITGALGSGVQVFSNNDGVRSGHTLEKKIIFTFNMFTGSNVFWRIHIVQKGAATTVVGYRIEYEQIK
ncbi:hypothetical protein GKC30_01255 [Pseudodesulfovibrio sp. F-1]|uniref:Uncharacterized protein n=2 Tax=Pseudodesulfovibrio alkaliphilus TaxID=2661613 RepID=A0A7K1KJP8_9BACT|nr:hypothetical protein [Pseudodesulfovibrio alkaliphilus]